MVQEINKCKINIYIPFQGLTSEAEGNLWEEKSVSFAMSITKKKMVTKDF